jgi:hypothetical protein
MKTITTSGSVRKADSSLDATLNPVELPSKEIVSWGVAFPRPGHEGRTPAAAARRAGFEGLAT